MKPRDPKGKDRIHRLFRPRLSPGIQSTLRSRRWWTSPAPCSKHRTGSRLHCRRSRRHQSPAIGSLEAGSCQRDWNCSGCRPNRRRPCRTTGWRFVGRRPRVAPAGSGTCLDFPHQRPWNSPSSSCRRSRRRQSLPIVPDRWGRHRQRQHSHPSRHPGIPNVLLQTTCQRHQHSRPRWERSCCHRSHHRRCRPTGTDRRGRHQAGRSRRQGRNLDSHD